MIDFISFAIENSLAITRLMYDHVLFLNIIIRFVKNKNIEEFNEEQEEYKMLLLELLTFADKKVTAKFIRESILITDYTDLLESKTDIMSKLTIDPDINKLSLNINAKPSNYAFTNEDKEKLKMYMIRLIEMLKKSLKRYYKLKDEHDLKELEMFFDGNLISHFIHECKLFIYTIDFFNKQIKFTPSYVYCLNFEIAQLSYDHCNYIYQMNNPVSDIYNKSIDESLIGYHNMLIEEQIPMSPQSIKILNEQCQACTSNFIKWNNEMLKSIIHDSYYNLIIPLLYDHILREANYFNYLLENFSSDNLIYENIPF